jgi:hypothetical protein
MELLARLQYSVTENSKSKGQIYRSDSIKLKKLQAYPAAQVIKENKTITILYYYLFCNTSLRLSHFHLNLHG